MPLSLVLSIEFQSISFVNSNFHIILFPLIYTYLLFKRASKNYIGKILPNFDPPPPNLDKHRHLANPLPHPHLRRPIPICPNYQDFYTYTIYTIKFRNYYYF